MINQKEEDSGQRVSVGGALLPGRTCLIRGTPRKRGCPRQGEAPKHWEAAVG